MTNYTYYMLEFSCLPGGARKNNFYVCNSFKEIKNALIEDLCDNLGIYMASWYGEHIFLYIMENNILIHKIDLHPYILISIEDFFNIQFENGDRKIIRLFRLSTDEDEDEDDLDIFCDLTCGLDEIKRVVSDDFCKAKIEASSSESFILDSLPVTLRKSQYTIHIDIKWPNIPRIRGNVKDLVEMVNHCGDGKNSFNYGYNNTK